jgi:hypothetical protein
MTTIGLRPSAWLIGIAVAMSWLPNTALAWGDEGHKVVCAIAFEKLNDKARGEVTRLIAKDDMFQSFADSCVWPDHPRKRAAEHFINLKRSVGHITSATCTPNTKCIFGAIAVDVDVSYCVMSGNLCAYEPGNDTFDPGEQEKSVMVDATYLTMHEQVVKDRLKRAGVRLALLLNRALGQ